MSFEMTFSVLGRPRAYVTGVRKESGKNGATYNCEVGSVCELPYGSWSKMVSTQVDNPENRKKHPLVFLRDLLNSLPLDEIAQEESQNSQTYIETLLLEMAFGKDGGNHGNSSR